MWIFHLKVTGASQGFAFRKKKSLQFFEIRKCVRERKVHISIVFNYAYCARISWKIDSLQKTQLLKLAIVYCIVVHDDSIFSCLRRMGLGTNVKTAERMKWDISESLIRKESSLPVVQKAQKLKHLEGRLKSHRCKEIISEVCQEGDLSVKEQYWWSRDLTKAGGSHVKVGMWCLIPATNRWFLLMLKGITPTPYSLWHCQYSEVNFSLWLETLKKNWLYNFPQS